MPEKNKERQIAIAGQQFYRAGTLFKSDPETETARVRERERERQHNYLSVLKMKKDIIGSVGNALIFHSNLLKLT